MDRRQSWTGGSRSQLTTSSGFAWSEGRRDAESSLDETLAHLRTLAESVPVPVNGDFRDGFIAGLPDLGETIRRLVAYAEAGAECLYAPGIRAREDILAVVEAVAPRPVNVLGRGSTHQRRWGPGPRGVDGLHRGSEGDRRARHLLEPRPQRHGFGDGKARGPAVVKRRVPTPEGYLEDATPIRVAAGMAEVLGGFPHLRDGGQGMGLP